MCTTLQRTACGDSCSYHAESVIVSAALNSIYEPPVLVICPVTRYTVLWYAWWLASYGNSYWGHLSLPFAGSSRITKMIKFVSGTLFLGLFALKSIFLDRIWRIKWADRTLKWGRAKLLPIRYLTWLGLFKHSDRGKVWVVIANVQMLSRYHAWSLLRKEDHGFLLWSDDL